jgi:1-acyl-sn-glycerol-3-phosphate acyltransferase
VGPLITVSNHISFLEVPVIFTHLQPRPVTGFAKAESWQNPLYRILFNLWGAIPIKRGEADLSAMRKGLEALQAGKILGISPEGTRSRDGRLGKGHPGVVTLALNSGAPLLPLVYFGGEHLNANLRRLRRTDFYIRVGQRFYLDPHGEKPTKEVRQKMVDEIMYQIAALLPPPIGAYTQIWKPPHRITCASSLLIPKRAVMLSTARLMIPLLKSQTLAINLYCLSHKTSQLWVNALEGCIKFRVFDISLRQPQ